MAMMPRMKKRANKAPRVLTAEMLLQVPGGILTKLVADKTEANDDKIK
jgi:hypothetical protein